MDHLSMLIARQYDSHSRGRRLATGAIVGIAIACFVVFVAFLLCCYCCCFRKRRASRKEIHYGDAPPAGGYYNGGGGMMGKLRGMMGGNRAGAYNTGPGVAEAGYGGGYPHHGVQQPAPAYR